jgi:hypothetical protein
VDTDNCRPDKESGGLAMHFANARHVLMGNSKTAPIKTKFLLRHALPAIGDHYAFPRSMRTFFREKGTGFSEKRIMCEKPKIKFIGKFVKKRKRLDHPSVLRNCEPFLQTFNHGLKVRGRSHPECE